MICTCSTDVAVMMVPAKLDSQLNDDPDEDGDEAACADLCHDLCKPHAFEA